MKNYINVFPQLQWIYVKRWVAEAQIQRFLDGLFEKTWLKYKDQFIDSIFTGNPVLMLLRKKGVVIKSENIYK